ncbi:MAG: lytic transglycosylase [Betaproteobacteria bacterium HGW-Betaproteobacteria-11]|nr:MAG: lytic transglycosylase [Betaproteobacteria bacterium HGW-Betaproteobacteria-11]
MPIRRLLVLLLLFAHAAPGHADLPLNLTPALPAVSGAMLLPARDAALPLLDRGKSQLVETEEAIPLIDLTTPPDDLWQRVRNGFSMPDLDSPLVARQQAWFLNRPELLQRIFGRCQRYLYYVVAELEKRGMPAELALLPVIESSYNPQAASPARALGMWQFIPSTGKNYKLKQNAWFDERRDIVASTDAALNYLQYIYQMHGDWHLALASYNWGEGAVGRAIARNRSKGSPTDYPHLAMPAETRNYVPKLQAIKNIIADPALFGLKLEPIPNRPYFATVERNEKMDVVVAAQLAEIPLDEFIALNPAYSRPVMPRDADSPLVLPAAKVAVFRDNLEEYKANNKPLSAWNTHMLKRGEKLDAVARRYGLSVDRLKQLNGLTRRSKVRPGLALLVPGKDATGYEALAAHLPKTPLDAPRAAKTRKRGHGAKAGGTQRSTALRGKVRRPAARHRKR